MNVLFSLTNLELGGAQIFALRLASAFAAHSGQTVYVYDHHPEYFQPGMTDQLPPSVKVLSYSRFAFVRFLTWKLHALIRRLGFSFGFRDWLNQRMFLRCLRTRNITIINSHMSESDYIIARLIGQTSCKLVTTMHGEYEMGTENPNHIGKNLAFILSKMSGLIYIADKNLKAVAQALPASQVPLVRKICIGIPAQAVPAKMPLRSNLNIGNSAFVLGMFARGIPEKGWEQAIAAFREVSLRFPEREIHLVLMGNGSYLKDLCDNARLERLHLLQFGERPLDCFPYIALFDVTLLPSYFPGESVPNSVIESLYWCKPVIANRIGEIPWMMDHEGETAGFLLEPRADGKADTKELADRIGAYITEPALLAKHRVLATHAFQKFTIETVVQRYLQVFNEVAAT